LISAAQIRAARAPLGIDQRAVAGAAGLSLPTTRRMEASEGNVRGNVDSLVKPITAPDNVAIKPIQEDAIGQGGGRSVRLKT
jgi:hypothetical protein